MKIVYSFQGASYVRGLCILKQCDDVCLNYAYRSNKSRFVILQSFQRKPTRWPPCRNCPFSNTVSFLPLLVHQQTPFSFFFFLASPLIGHRKNFTQYIQSSSCSNPHARWGMQVQSASSSTQGEKRKCIALAVIEAFSFCCSFQVNTRC